MKSRFGSIVNSLKLDFCWDERLSNHLLHENIQRLKVYMVIFGICELIFLGLSAFLKSLESMKSEILILTIAISAILFSKALQIIDVKSNLKIKRLTLNAIHILILLITVYIAYLVRSTAGYGITAFTIGIMLTALTIVRNPIFMISGNLLSFYIFAVIDFTSKNEPISYFNIFIAVMVTIIVSISAVLRYRRAREIFNEKIKIQELNQQLAYYSSTDKLTGLANRMKSDEELGKMVQYAKRYNYPLSLILVDIDHFKQFNDSQGHQFGDCVLTTVANILKQNTRQTDFIGRWGGDEFLVICPHTDLQNGILTAERIKTAVAKADFPNCKRVTVSGGVGQITGNETDIGLFSRIDAALYWAKESGRNRMEVSYLDESLVQAKI